MLELLSICRMITEHQNPMLDTHILEVEFVGGTRQATTVHSTAKKLLLKLTKRVTNLLGPMM